MKCICVWNSLLKTWILIIFLHTSQVFIFMKWSTHQRCAVIFLSFLKKKKRKRKESFHSFKLKAWKNLLQIRRGLDDSIFTISDHCIEVPVQYSEEPIWICKMQICELWGLCKPSNILTTNSLIFTLNGIKLSNYFYPTINNFKIWRSKSNALSLPVPTHSITCRPALDSPQISTKCEWQTKIKTTKYYPLKSQLTSKKKKKNYTQIRRKKRCESLHFCNLPTIPSQVRTHLKLDSRGPQISKLCPSHPHFSKLQKLRHSFFSVFSSHPQN